MSMSRTVAIIVTIIAALFCGLPGLALFCFGSLGGVGGLLPGGLVNTQGTPQDLLLGVTMFVCIGLLMMAVPVAVGWLAFQVSKAEDLPLVKYE